MEKNKKQINTVIAVKFIKFQIINKEYLFHYSCITKIYKQIVKNSSFQLSKHFITLINYMKTNRQNFIPDSIYNYINYNMTNF